MQTRSDTEIRFDSLFGRLLSTLAEEDDMRSGGEAFARLIEVRDRLHALRSDLAAVRTRMAAEATTWLNHQQPPRYAV